MSASPMFTAPSPFTSPHITTPARIRLGATRLTSAATQSAKPASGLRENSMRVTTVASIVRVAPFYGQQVPALGQQKVLTSETQSAVQPNDGSQHVGSWVQTLATQGSLQPVGHSAAPAVQTLWHWQVGCVVVVVVEVVEVVVVVVGGLVVVVVDVVVVVVVGGAVVVVLVLVVVGVSRSLQPSLYAFRAVVPITPVRLWCQGKKCCGPRPPAPELASLQPPPTQGRACWQFPTNSA